MFFKKINTDLNAFIERDPAAPNKAWVILLWPGFHAVFLYRVSHILWQYPLTRPLARIISGFSRFLTSVDIHPAAFIEEGFVIDHATGVVIGETAIIGKNVTLYHGVTLGGVAPSVNSLSQVGVKRHPTLEEEVVVGANASILGDIIIGKNAQIGANTVVTQSIEAYATAVGNPARVIMKKQNKQACTFAAYGVNNQNIRDITMEEIENIKQKLKQLEEKLESSKIKAPSDSLTQNKIGEKI